MQFKNWLLNLHIVSKLLVLSFVISIIYSFYTFLPMAMELMKYPNFVSNLLVKSWTIVSVFTSSAVFLFYVIVLETLRKIDARLEKCINNSEIENEK